MSLLCDVMTNASISEPFDRLALLSRNPDLFDNDVSFQDYVKFLSNVTIDPARGGKEKEREERELHIKIKNVHVFK